MKKSIILIATFLIAVLSYSQEIEVINGHAHNDYKNKNPLLDAIENGFTSVEVDVHLVNDNLYVSHDFPKKLNPALTIEALYLNPLKKHILMNNGSVYPNYSGTFYLMIDFKSSAKPTYDKLKRILSNYLSIISITKNGEEQKGSVKIFISGKRPIGKILNDEPKLVGIDGKPKHLKKNIPTNVMPVISDKYSHVLSWDGYGKININDHNKLIRLVQKTHAQNKKLRLWGAPDNENVWRFLLDNGVDLINTDLLKEFREFVLTYNSSCN